MAEEMSDKPQKGEAAKLQKDEARKPQKGEGISEGEARSAVPIKKSAWGEGKFPMWGDMLAYVGIFIVASVVAVFTQSIALRAGMIFEASVSLSYTVQFTLAIAGMLIYRRIRGGRGRLFRFSIKWYNSTLVLLGLLLVIITGVVIEPLLNLFPDRYFEAIDKAIGNGGWTILTTVVLAPVLEEMLFRGVVLESLRPRTGAVKAILISAAIFGLVHVNPPQVVNAFVMGVVMGYIYILTESLFSVIVIHAANNGLAYLLKEITGNGATDLRYFIPDATLYWIIYAVSLALFIAALVGIAVVAQQRKTEAR
jgi:membrane protease YdiL (CAAX protease family)